MVVRTALLDPGSSGALLSDPIVFGDVSGNGRVNAADASLVARFAALIEVPQIPSIPSGVATAGSAPTAQGPGLPGAATAAAVPTNPQAAPPPDSSSADSSSPPPEDSRYSAVDLAIAVCAKRLFRLICWIFAIHPLDRVSGGQAPEFRIGP